MNKTSKLKREQKFPKAALGKAKGVVAVAALLLLGILIVGSTGRLPFDPSHKINLFAANENKTAVGRIRTNFQIL